MTAILNTLKLTAARKTRALPDVVKRRNKLLMKLGEQRELAAALNDGRHYAPTRYRSFTDADTGARVVKEVPVRIKPWFWTGEKGEVLLAVQYGRALVLDWRKRRSAAGCAIRKPADRTAKGQDCY